MIVNTFEFVWNTTDAFVHWNTANNHTIEFKSCFHKTRILRWFMLLLLKTFVSYIYGTIKSSK